MASIVGVVVHGIEGDLHGTRYGSRLILRTRERLAATDCRFNRVVVCRQSRALELHRVAGLFAIGQQIDAIDGLVLTAVCIPLMPWFLGMFTDDRTVIELGSQYAGIAFSFSVVIMVSLSFEKIYQAVGRMKETMLALLSGCITNIAGCH